MAKDSSQLTRIYLALWRKACLEKDSSQPPVEIRASNFSVATSMRVGLYRAIRPYRNKQAFDSTLEAAAEYIVPTLEKPEDPAHPCVIVFKPRKALTELELQLAGWGIDAADLITPEEALAKAAIDRLIETPVKESKPNPFYKREG